MKKRGWSSGIVGAFLLMTTAASVYAQGPMRMWPPFRLQPVETSFEVSGRFTAQRRPRVTVLHFEDTNTGARDERYGDSIEAMLVTFLKRKSQFVVVERTRIKDVLEERQRMSHGMIHLDPDDPSARQLLDKIDAFILGSVTLLDVVDDVETAKKPDAVSQTLAQGASGDTTSREEIREKIRGPRIEIDVKLISRFDGRIIAAAQRRGPVACLRSIVERLGIAIEQEYLRPYYGRLNVRLSDPEYVRVFLTPILLDTALDEEKPPVELGATVRIGFDQDVIESWTLDPTSYTIENLLSGYYTLRLERSGYEGVESERGRWEARDRFGRIVLYDHVDRVPFEQDQSDVKRFVVHVDPLKTNVIDLTARQFAFRKQGGSLAPRVKRQYLDTDFSHTPKRVLLISKKLDIDRLGQPAEYADDLKCDLFDEKSPIPPDYGRTYVATGQTFDFDNFKGGELIVEDYLGEIVPPGVYQMALWEPYFELEKFDVTVHPQDTDKQTKTVLSRETLSLELATTGIRPGNLAVLQGRDTHHQVDLNLDFGATRDHPGLPVDVYTASTNITGLDGWHASAELLPGLRLPPIYDTTSEPNKPRLLDESKKRNVPVSPLIIKTRFGIAGHLDVFSKLPDRLAADSFYDREVLEILNLLIYGHEPPPAKKRRFLGGLADRKSTTRAGQGTNPPAGPSGSPGSSAPQQPSPPPDPDGLRERLARHLELIDLLLLDAQDMAHLRRSPEVADVIQRYVAAGGALFAFVAEPGDYREAAGAPLEIEKLSRRTRRFELTPGAVRDIVPTFQRKKVKVKSKRPLPELPSSAAEDSWRVVAFTQGTKAPRIIERGSRTEGGYVALWLDNPASFRGPLGGTVPKVEETRSNMEAHVLEWARYLMYRRYDKSGDQRRRAEEQLAR